MGSGVREAAQKVLGARSVRVGKRVRATPGDWRYMGALLGVCGFNCLILSQQAQDTAREAKWGPCLAARRFLKVAS